ncbi:MAG: hypothetical protein O2871_02795, partial [bacterium]|nr:hypothetical protein [bacterium]
MKIKITSYLKLKFYFHLFLFLSYFSILAINFTGFAYAVEEITKEVSTETKIEFNWVETDNGVKSNIAITDNETYTYENVGIKFFNLPSESLKLAVSKIEKSALPDSTQAESDAYDIKLLDENNNEVTKGFEIQVTFYGIENTDNLSVISFQDTNDISQANLEESNINDGNIVVNAGHLTIFVVVKIVDHTSGTPPTDYTYSDTAPADASLPSTINIEDDNMANSSTYISTKGLWPPVSTDIGDDYIDFHFDDITGVNSISTINFISNLRIQVIGGAGGVDNTDFDAKLYGKQNDDNFLDLAIDKFDLVPNFNSGGSSANYELISIPIDPSNLDLTDFVIRYSLAGKNLGPYPTASKLRGYFDYAALDVQYITDTTKPIVDLVFPSTGPAATSFQAVFSENVNPTEAENPANYFLTDWPGAGGSGDLVGDVTIVYNPTTFTATVTFTNAGWYVSPEQQWGVENIHDLVGNLLAVSPYSEYSTPMIAPVTTNTGIDANWHNTTVTVTLTCADTNGSGCKTTYYTTDTIEPNLTSTTGNSFTLSTQGQYTVKYFSTDNAGNTETIKTATNTVKIDTTNPNGTVVINSNDTYTNNKTVNLTLTATDTPSGVSNMAFSNDDVTYSTLETFSTSKTWDLIDTEGLQTVYIKIIDLAGNEFVTSDTIILDKTIPVSTITLPSNTGNNTTTYTDSWNGVIIGVSSDNYKVANVQVSIKRTSDGFYFNGTDWVTSASEILLNTTTGNLYATWSYDLNPDPAGDETYTIISHATDNATNFENSYTVTLIYDITIPQVSLAINPTTPNGENNIYISKPKVTLTANDNYNVSYIEYQINSTTSTWTRYTKTVEINEGITKFYYRSVDKAGNISTVGLKNISVDVSAPDSVENVGASFSSILTETSIYWEANDDDIDSIKIYKSQNSNVDQSSSNFFIMVDKNINEITDDDIDRVNTYYYLLVPFDEEGNQGYSVKIKIEIPEDEAEEIIVTTETFAAQQIVVPDTITPP